MKPSTVPCSIQQERTLSFGDYKRLEALKMIWFSQFAPQKMEVKKEWKKGNKSLRCLCSWPPCSSDQIRKSRIKDAQACEHATSKKAFSVRLHVRKLDERIHLEGRRRHEYREEEGEIR